MKSSYLLFNKLIAAAMAAIFFYCALLPFLGDWAVRCWIQQATGKLCISCGLTRGMHEILLLNFSKASAWNVNAIPVFIFFLATLILRIIINIFLRRNIFLSKINYVVIADILISVAMFLICFKNFFTEEILVK